MNNPSSEYTAMCTRLKLEVYARTILIQEISSAEDNGITQKKEDKLNNSPPVK